MESEPAGPGCGAAVEFIAANRKAEVGETGSNLVSPPRSDYFNFNEIVSGIGRDSLLNDAPLADASMAGITGVGDGDFFRSAVTRREVECKPAGGWFETMRDDREIGFLDVGTGADNRFEGLPCVD